MEEELQEHIFEPFFTTKETGKGTGLGLAMVYGIVKSHGGYITCESEPAHGTAFALYFPAIENDKEREEEIEVTTPVEGGSETILLVDDEESIRHLGTELLSSFGYNVLTAENGESAVEIEEPDRQPAP